MTTVQALLDNPGTWTLAPAQSSVRFKNKTMWGLVPVKGEFTDVSGDGQITATGAVFGKVDIRAASLRTGIGKRDEHLRSPDFFDVEKYPEISVVVTEATATGERTADLRAELTVRGTTHPLPLSATVEGVGEGRDKDTVRISAQTSIDRTAFGVSGNMVGMMPATTTLIADLVFTKA